MKPSVHTETLRFRIDPQTREELALIAQHERLQTSELIRRELREVVARYQGVVQTASHRAQKVAA